MNEQKIARKLARELEGGDPDARIYYLGGSKYVVEVPAQAAGDLMKVFPRSFKRPKRKGSNVSFYVTEKASKLADQYCKEHGISVGSSPMWDLAPGEMPSW